MNVKRGLLLGLVLTLGAAGCGGGDGDNGVATAGGTASPTASAKAGSADDADAALKYVQCMRENGVPNMPDPKVGADGEIQMSLNADGVDPATVEAAQEKCKKLLPSGGEPQKADPETVEKLRQYSKCMRDSGLPDYPDPTDQGLQVDGNKFPADDPKVKAAEEKCKQHMPQKGGGSLTQETRE